LIKFNKERISPPPTFPILTDHSGVLPKKPLNLQHAETIPETRRSFRCATGQARHHFLGDDT
jgi:hypothetical protein